MKKRALIFFTVMIFITTGCGRKERHNQSVKFENTSDILTFSLQYGDEKNQKVITENLLINKKNRAIQEIQLDNAIFLDIFRDPTNVMSTSQYYTNRVIIGGMNGGGHSIELIKDDSGSIRINEHKFNIIFYDEVEKKYITQTTSDDEMAGFNILNEALEKVDFIPYPGMASEFRTAAIYPYNLDTIIYAGHVDGKKFQVQKYDMKLKAWKNVAQLLQEEIYNGYDGYLYMSHNEKYPDWVSLTINSLWSIDKESKTKNINVLYFVNLKTGEVKETSIPLFSKTPIVSMPGVDVSMMQTKDRVVILDMNPEGIKVLREINVEDIVPYGEQHINSVLQYGGDDIVINAPNGILKYDFNTKKGEYIYDNGADL